MSRYKRELVIRPSQKAEAALSIISQDSTIPVVMERTGATAAEVERWVLIIRECAQELFSNRWGEKKPGISISTEDLLIIQKQLLRLNAKIEQVTGT